MKSVMQTATEQQAQWDQIFSESDSYFGEQPSSFAKISLELFRKRGVRTVLETGCGQGRDTFLFAEDGLQVTALDYSQNAVLDIKDKISSHALPQCIDLRCFDVRRPLPFEDESFDAFYSHMLMCMELTTAEIACALSEVHRVLKPGGLAVYSARSIFDRHYRAGEHLGEELFEIGKLAVHFFSEDKIRGMASGFKILDINRIEEGALPRDLFCVTMEKSSIRYAPSFSTLPAGADHKHAPLTRNRSRAYPHCPGGT